MTGHDTRRCDSGPGDDRVGRRADPARHAFPVRLRGGYHDGARLIGLDGDVGVYYNRAGRSILRYRYEPDDGVLHADREAETGLPTDTSLGTFLRERPDMYTELSAWGCVVIGDDGRA